VKLRKPLTIERLFPNAAGRAAADAIVDAIPVTATMSEFLDAWEGAYWVNTGVSPFRKDAK
jgi:hypothetical protein